MTAFGLVLMVTAFLSGAAAAAFVMLVIGIRQGDRPWHLHTGRDTATSAVTRTVLGTGTWPNTPVAIGDHDEGKPAPQPKPRHQRGMNAQLSPFGSDFLRDQ